MASATIGLIVNPAAGRDIRRLTGGASVVDNYAKRRVAECVLAGLSIVEAPLTALLMPDTAGIAGSAINETDGTVSASLADLPRSGSAADSRRAAAHFHETCEAIVVLGGDGTTRDVALECGDTPLLPVSTGTNNVVPTAVDGTVAGAAAALIATGAVTDVVERHGMVEARVESGASVTGIASVELVDRSFVGTRAMLDPADLQGGIVSRANPGDIGLPGIAGSLGVLSPTDPMASFLLLERAAESDRTVRAIVAPGMTTEIGIVRHESVEQSESVTVDVEEAVLGADGERELEVVNETVTFHYRSNGPNLASVERVLESAAENGVLRSNV